MTSNGQSTATSTRRGGNHCAQSQPGPFPKNHSAPRHPARQIPARHPQRPIDYAGISTGQSTASANDNEPTERGMGGVRLQRGDCANGLSLKSLSSALKSLELTQRGRGACLQRGDRASGLSLKSPSSALKSRDMRVQKRAPRVSPGCSLSTRIPTPQDT